MMFAVLVLNHSAKHVKMKRFGTGNTSWSCTQFRAPDSGSTQHNHDRHFPHSKKAQKPDVANKSVRAQSLLLRPLFLASQALWNTFLLTRLGHALFLAPFSCLSRCWVCDAASTLVWHASVHVFVWLEKLW
jgi:hypothetical protein